MARLEIVDQTGRRTIIDPEGIAGSLWQWDPINETWLYSATVTLDGPEAVVEFLSGSGKLSFHVGGGNPFGDQRWI